MSASTSSGEGVRLDTETTDDSDVQLDSRVSEDGKPSNLSSSTPSSNVYTPLLSGSRLLVSAPGASNNSRLNSSNGEAKRHASKPNLALVPHRVRGARSSVRPFFCCGSELSLVSLVDGLELKESCTRNALKIKSIECSESSSEEEEISQDSEQISRSPAANISTSRPVVRRKKKDKHATKKKFWSLRFRGRWNTRWRVSQPQCPGSHRMDQTHCNTSPMSQGTYHATNSPSTGLRSIRSLNMVTSDGQLLSIPDFERLYPTEDINDIRRRERAEEMAQGVEIQRNLLSRALQSNADISHSVAGILQQRHQFGLFNSDTVLPSPETPSEEDYSLFMNNFMLQLQEARNGLSETAEVGLMPRIYTQVDYIHCLVPKLTEIMGCPFYWGIMDRYEAERLLDNKPEGTFLLRDSAQEDFLFSVSFRRYNRSLHARVEQWNHRFSFDAHDPCVYSASSVCELMEHYKDPSSCMFFEPMLTRPLPRNFTFSLQHICRAVICDSVCYDQIHELPLPNSLKQFLQFYHYKQKVRVRHFDGSGVACE